MISVKLQVCAVLMTAHVVCVHGGALAVCDDTSCSPPATCRQFPTYIACECPYGKTGPDCTLDDPCLPRKEDCPNGTLCFGSCNPNVVCNGANGIAQCAGCVAGWTEADCRTDMDECAESDFPDVCLHGGVCTNLPGDFKCTCTAGWVGKDCFCKKGSKCDQKGVEILDQYTGVDPDDYDNPNERDTATGLTFHWCMILHLLCISPILSFLL